MGCVSNSSQCKHEFSESLDMKVDISKISNVKEKDISLDVVIFNYYKKMILIDESTIYYSFDNENFINKYEGVYVDINRRFLKLDKLHGNSLSMPWSIQMHIDTEGKRPEYIYLKFKDDRNVEYNLKAKINY